MKKLIIVLILFVLILQNINVFGGKTDVSNKQADIISFTDPRIEQDALGTYISFKETQYYLHIPGKPYLPTYLVTYTYPFETRIKEVKATFQNSVDYQLQVPLKSLPAPVTAYQNKIISLDAEQLEYQKTNKYPATMTYVVDSGIKDGEHLIFLNVYITPFTYHSIDDRVTMYHRVILDIALEESILPVSFPDEYDLVVIAPSTFSEAIQPLIDHKNSIGLSSFLKTTEEIYAQYPGIDEQEQIKYFIKDAIETKGITYVLLIGGRNGGVFEEKWWVPVRYANLDDGYESSYISDLYYADIYNETGEFATWDTDGNGIFAEWKGFRKDILGLIPDVYLGRLPCRNIKEVRIMVEKIIEYETTDKDSWFNHMVVVGGDSAPGDQYYEGEEENKQAIEYMQDFTVTRCWTSDGTFTGQTDVMNAISQGCGFLFFDGHANPASWSTHPPNDQETWITGLTVFDMPKLENGNRFPVCVVGGCHIAQFNVSLLNIIRDIIEYGPIGYFMKAPYKFYHMEWVPRCWSWQLASMKEGGSIATLGYTGLDWFAVGDEDGDGIPDCNQYYSGFMNTHFFKNYGVNNMTILGQAHTQTLIDYINTHPPMNFELDCKTVQEFVLLGDPSLRLG
jgi:hypothetical protein